MNITYLDSSNISTFLGEDYLLIFNDGKAWTENPQFDLFLKRVSKILEEKPPELEFIRLVNREAITYEVMVGAVILCCNSISVWGNYTIFINGKSYDNQIYINGDLLENTMKNALGWDDLVRSKATLVNIELADKISVAFEGKPVLELSLHR